MADAFHTLSVSESLQRLGTSLDGLSEAEAAERLQRDGPNELPPPKRTSLLIILLRQFAGPLIAVLLIAAVVSAVLGDFGDAAFIGGVLLFNALIGFFQEVKAEREIIRLFTLMRTTARVERGDELSEIDSAELVAGDIVWLESGARIPADMRLVQERDAGVDEAPLTGESMSVTKTLEPVPDAGAIPAERRNMLFAGTTLTRGRAVGVVTATGGRTELGGVARGLEATRRGKPPLVLRMEKLSRQLAAATLIGCAAVFSVGMGRGFPFVETFLMTVALAVAAIPEGLPVAITLSLAVGLRRMSGRGVLVRRMEAVEGLGSCTVICTDKTGTLTLNELTVSRIATVSSLFEVSGAGYALEGEIKSLQGATDDHALEALLETVCLANEGTIARKDREVSVAGDPTDIALLVVGRKHGLKREELLARHPEAGALPFESERQFAATFHQGAEGISIHLKGAAERVLSMCRDAMGVDGSRVGLDVEAVRTKVDELSSMGLRVLGVARGRLPSDTLEDVPERPHDLTFLGLVAMRDAPRPEAAEAVAACRRARVRVIVATGDHARTALAVAHELGIADRNDRAVTSRELEGIPDDEFDRTAREVNVFARVTPQDKLRLVQSLQRQGQMVSMTGDGANDAGALKAAHIGVAMGLRGTDVAKEAADIVITDDNFASIVGGIEEGRIVHDNVRNVVALLVGTGLGEVLAILACISAGLPIPLSPVQLLWANLVTGGLQTVGLALEPGEPDILSRPPRPPDERIFNRIMIMRTVLPGMVIGGTICVTFWYLLEVMHYSAFAAGNVVLLLLVLIENIHIGNCRSERRSGLVNSPLRNPWVLWAAIIAQGTHLLAMHWGPTQRLLGLEPVDIKTWLSMFAISLSVFVVVEIHKLWVRLRERVTPSRT